MWSFSFSMCICISFLRQYCFFNYGSVPINLIRMFAIFTTKQASVPVVYFFHLHRFPSFDFPCTFTLRLFVACVVGILSDTPFPNNAYVIVLPGNSGPRLSTLWTDFLTPSNVHPDVDTSCIVRHTSKPTVPPRCPTQFTLSIPLPSILMLNYSF